MDQSTGTPITPDQYRTLADEFERTRGRHPLPVELAVQSALRAAADEVDRLRAVIENARHGWDCTDPDGGSFCTCWKADAL